MTRAAGLLLITLVGLVMLTGCASTTPRLFDEDPGVTVRVTMKNGGSFSGTLVGMEEGALVLHRSLPKSQDLTVVSRDGVEIVYLDGSPIGSAVEIRDVDVLVRERVAFFEVDDVRVVSRAYVGWGTGIAAVLAFLLVKVLEDV